jgi:DNA (cytosine-5)-methyltransferase 1
MKLPPALTFLDLCAGIGGCSLGLEQAGMECKGQVEIEDYCTTILEKHWPHVPKWKDIRTLDLTELPATDLICGGFPCQPFSSAGRRGGNDDSRYLWPEVFNIVKALRPSWCLFENVTGFIQLGLDQALSDLESCGYACQALAIPACSVKAPHKRERVWIIAHAAGVRRVHYKAQNEDNYYRKSIAGFKAFKEDDIFPDDEEQEFARNNFNLRGYYGVPFAVDRITALGNAVVPQLVYRIGLAIKLASTPIAYKTTERN